MKKLYLFLSFLVATTYAAPIVLCQTVDVGGLWIGTLTQGQGSATRQFIFEMSLSQSSSRVSGSSTIRYSTDQQYYAIMNLTGSFEDRTFSFREVSKLANYPKPGTFWCMKQGELHIRELEGQFILEGNWSDARCAPGQIYLVRRKRFICDDPSIESEYDPDHPNYHQYGVEEAIETLICTTIAPECNRDLVFETMLEEARFIAPTDDRHSVTECKKTKVDIIPFSDDFVKTTIDRTSRSIINYTLENHHLLHPGRVIRKVIERDGKVYIKTFGEGSGAWPKDNEFFAPNVWLSVDKRFQFRLQFPELHRENNQRK